MRPSVTTSLSPCPVKILWTLGRVLVDRQWGYHGTAIDSQAVSEDYLYICTRGGEEPIVMTFVTKIVNNWSWDRECSR